MGQVYKGEGGSDATESLGKLVGGAKGSSGFTRGVAE